MPDFSIGSPTIWNDTFEENYFFDGPNPVSDGEHLFSVSGYNTKMYVWKSIPNESGAKPDIVYNFRFLPLVFEPNDITLHNSTFAVVGTNSLILIWNSLPLNGELPDVVVDLYNYTHDRVTIGGVFIDDNYMYVWANCWLYIWNGTPTKPRHPDLQIFMPESISRIFSDGKHLITSTRDRKVVIFNVSDIINASIPFEAPLEEEGKKEKEEESPEPEDTEEPPEDQASTENLPKIVLSMYMGNEPLLAPQEVFSDGEHLFVVDLELSLVLIWSEFPTEDDQLPDVVIGKGRHMNTRDGLFWPQTVWFDGHYLWIGEVKFSGRLLRFSVG